MSPRWDKRLRLPKSDGGATICEKHEFIEAHFRDPEMSWEVDQAVTQAKDDGKRMEARIQELGEEANNLEEALDEMTAHRDRLASDLQATRAELEKRLENMQKVIDEAMSIRCALSGLQGNAKSLAEALNLCFQSLTDVRYLIEEPPAGSP